MSQKNDASKRNTFNKISIKLIIPFVIIVILLIIAGSIFIYQSSKVSESITKDIPKNLEAISKNSELDSHAQFIRYYDEVLTQSARNYAFTKDIKWRTIYYEFVPLLDENINYALEEGDKKDIELFESIDVANQALIDFEEQAILLVDADKANEAIVILESVAYWNQKEIYTQGLTNYVERRGKTHQNVLITSTKSLQQTTIAINTTVTRSRYMITTLIIIAILFGIYFGFYVTKSISKPINTLYRATEELKNGNYAVKVDIKTKDELEDLGKAFTAMSDTLGKLDQEKKKIEHAKTEFMSITSHEMRSPMTPMQGQLQMLLSGTFGKLSSKQRESLDIVLRNATRLDGIIQDFLEVSRIEAARLRFNFKKGTNINEPITRLVTEMKNFLPEKKIQIITKLDKIPNFEIDPDRAMQVLRNLTNNALKFTPENGKIEITTEKQGKNVLFTVKDSGIGISPENQSRIFEPFFQEEQTMYRQYGGTGLGLAICRGIVEAQGGRIWLESRKGLGTTFYFTFPIIPVTEIKPIKLLFSKKSDVEEKLESVFTEMLGPIGKSEVVTVKIKGLVRANITEYINEITKHGILTKETSAEFKQKIAKIFGKSTIKTSMNELQKQGLIAVKDDKRHVRAVGVSLSELQKTRQVKHNTKTSSNKIKTKDLLKKSK